MLRFKVFLFASLFILLLTSCAMSGDVTPPPTGAIPQDQEPSQELPPGHPTLPADALPTPPLPSGNGETPEDVIAKKPLGPISISGRVLTSSGLPTDGVRSVTLQSYEGMQPVLMAAANVDAAGNFKFENLDTSKEPVFIITASYKGNDFSSDVIHSTDLQTGELTGVVISVMDSISDTSSLVADRAHIFLDFNTPGQVQTAVLMVVSNPGEQIVTSQDGKPALVFELPPDASNLQFDGGTLGERFVKTDTGFGDMEPIYPGLRQHEIMFAFDVPYERKQDLILKFPLPVDSAIVALPSVGVRLKTGQLQENGQREIEGSTFHFYETGSLPANSALTLKLTGRVGSTVNPNLNLIIGASILALVLAASTLWFWRRRVRPPVLPLLDPVLGKEENEESLLDAIVALDDVFRSGALPEEAYHQRRSDLKDRLKALKNRL